MNSYLRATLVSFFVLFIGESCLAKEWRGIVPLRSTRADVVRLVNQCAEQIEACAFSLPQEEVYILFSGGLSDTYDECARRLSPETVIFIQVFPKSEPKLDDLHLDKKTLKLFDASASLYRGHKGYVTMDGLVIDTYRGRVHRLVYIPERSQFPLCPVYFEEPELFIQTLVVHPPLTLSLDCPTEAIPPGSKVALRASAGVGSKRGPMWTVSAGRISSGQHTYRVTVDTTGTTQRSIIVTAEMDDGYGHLASTTCEIVIQQK